MKDHFDFEAPLGIFGKIVSKLFLVGYMKRLLEERNNIIIRYNIMLDLFL